MEADELFDFLDEQKEATVDASLVEFDGFVPTGLIAPWKSRVLYRHGSETEYDVTEVGYAVRRKMGDWGYAYYFDTPEKAAIAKDIMGCEWSAGAHWVFEATTADVINFSSDTAREKFGVDLFYSWQTAGIGATKHIEFHYLMLPAIVAAVASARGYDNAGFDVLPLFDLTRDHEYGWDDMDSAEKDAIREETLPLIGGKFGEEKIPIEEAVFWKQRTELWKSLGENDPKASQLIGDGEFATTSKQLDKCLRIFYMCPWQKPFWARVLNVSSPRPDAMTKAGKRLQVPLLVDFYLNQDAAEEAAGTTGSTSPATTGEPSVPDGWKDYPAEFKAEVKKIKESGKPLPVAFGEAGGEELFGCTLAEVTEWLDHV